MAVTPPADPLIAEGSRGRAAWDLFIVGAVLVTATVVPFQIAFLGEVGWAGSTVVYLLDAVFLIDIWLGFRTTFRFRGAEVLDRRAIAQRYRRTGFWTDVAGTVPLDLFFLGSSAALGGIPVALVLRANRLVRVVRLLRAFRSWERKRSTNTGYLRITKLVLGVFVLIHWIACGWFLVAVVEGFPPDSWVVVAGLESLDVGSQYLRSVYWGFVTTTTVGFGDITPSRNAEYLFTLVVMIVGASMYALIIGSIASLIRAVDAERSSFWNRVEGVSRFMQTRGVPVDVQARIQTYYEYLWDRHQGISTRQFLQDLPDSIRLDVLHHLTHDLTGRVPLFVEAEEPLRNALLMHLEPQIFVPGSQVVREGEVATGLYFVGSGRLAIRGEGGTKSFGEFEAGDYFGDLSLLLGERRTGSVYALSHSDVFFLPSTAFNRLRAEYPEFKEALRSISSQKSDKLADLVAAGRIL